ALPVLNREAVSLAIRACLALGCTVHERSVFARKNYFYPDLPKGYQISQFELPLATGGTVDVELETEQETVSVRLRRIHMEEDAGKSIHDRFEDATAVDLNRTGTPLIEMVSEPDLRTPAQVRAYLQQVKHILEYLDVSDCNMEEGSLRVDANVSVRPMGDTALHTKTELKNMNSFSGVEKALRVEIARQIDIVRGGGAVDHQTLLWDERRGEVRPMRMKEESHDYRYFPDPDLPELMVGREWVEEERDRLPELPIPRRNRFVDEYGLPTYDAGVLTSDRALADFYEEVAGIVGDAKEASNWIMGPVLALMKSRGETADTFHVRPAGLSELIALVSDGTINRNAGREVLDEMVATGEGASAIVAEKDLVQVSDASLLDEWIREALEANPEEVERFREGERRLQGFFMGEVMKRSRGKADPKEVARSLGRALEGG
ncbi:MAG: Asp-tRNA(Asn)/Glu-tRNA(Gln) amidotransferase subunit GatB, partial [Gemmatimonadota bacterium]